uniref:Ig-like domain-containing protein n=1 Tax=Sphaeramia orbicularis TaxID=375764 RepID=A0A672ZIR7_9TELE
HLYMFTTAQNRWGVMYTSTNICAVKGSSVTISCTYTFPPSINRQNTTVTKTLWFTRSDNNGAVDLKEESDSSDRVQYVCVENRCSVRISDLRQSDSAEYRFRFKTNQPGGSYSGLPGVYLSVTVAPTVPSVSFSPSGEIIEGSSVTLTCTSDANPPVTKYTWYKRGNNQPQSRGEGQQFVLSSITSTDSGSYSCVAWNSLGWKMSEYVYTDVKYPPRLPSVSVSPSGQIVEGSSVTLTCTSDANPPVTKYTWYKRGDNQLQSRGEGQQFVLSFINSSDSGSYSCQTENSLGQKMSEYVYIDVKCDKGYICKSLKHIIQQQRNHIHSFIYSVKSPPDPPRLPSVSVSPSGQIVEGSSVTLTCTSDANPPVTKYTWYKRGNNRLQSRGEGQQFVLSFIKSSDSGLYSCVAENSLERKMSKFVHIDVKCE